jgi:hypothetical protein
VLRRAAGWARCPRAGAGVPRRLLPRFWLALQAAPNAGERGALLLVRRRRRDQLASARLRFGCAGATTQPCLAGACHRSAIALTAIQRRSGATLIIGLALLRCSPWPPRSRGASWPGAQRADYSDELRLDI